jgi:collagenase-like PrtC family protease
MTGKLTLGPVLFHWAPEKLRDFYFRIADEAPVDSVCVGEVVCAKRAPFSAPHLPEIVERLETAGKEVVHSTLALIMNDREMRAARELAAAEEFFVEANDMATAALLAGRPHAIGPYVNVYNEGTLEYLAGRGALRVCLPVELSAPSLAVLAAVPGVESEVQVFGRLPLALSARCYHARSHGRHKDNCQFVCGEDPDGLVVETIDRRPFLAVNGTQTLSHTFCNLLGELDELCALGVRRFRLSPQDVDMVAVARLFRDVLDARQAPGAALELLAALVPGAVFSNGFYHGTEGTVWTEPPGAPC